MPYRTQPRKTSNSCLATRRRELGITQSKLCSMVRCSHNMVSYWESGRLALADIERERRDLTE